MKNSYTTRYCQKHLAVWTSLLSLFLLGLIVNPVEAHTEGKLQLSAAPAGSYKVSVWTSPDPARVGEVHVATIVSLAEDASPVLDADVLVRLTPLSGNGTPLSGKATTEDSENKFLYEAIMDVTGEGLYRVEVTIAGADGAMGDASFELDVQKGATGFNLLYLVAVALFLAAILLLVLARRGQPASD